MVENAVSKELLKPCVDELITSLKDNYVDLLKSTMITTFSNMFITEMKAENLRFNLNMWASRIDQKEDKR